MTHGELRRDWLSDDCCNRALVVVWEAVQQSTFHVTAGTQGYVEQSEADDWVGAKKALLASDGFQKFVAVLLPAFTGAPVGDADVFMMIPMMGLKHCWTMQGGREGQYFHALVIRTDETGEIEQPCDHD